MAVDKNKNTQVLVTLPNELLKEIEDFQFANRIKNRNEAIRTLVLNGLKSSKQSSVVHLAAQEDEA